MPAMNNWPGAEAAIRIQMIHADAAAAPSAMDTDPLYASFQQASRMLNEGLSRPAIREWMDYWDAPGRLEDFMQHLSGLIESLEGLDIEVAKGQALEDVASAYPALADRIAFADFTIRRAMRTALLLAKSRLPAELALLDRGYASTFRGCVEWHQMAMCTLDLARDEASYAELTTNIILLVEQLALRASSAVASAVELRRSVEAESLSAAQAPEELEHSPAADDDLAAHDDLADVETYCQKLETKLG